MLLTPGMEHNMEMESAGFYVIICESKESKILSGSPIKFIGLPERILEITYDKISI